MSLQIIFGWYLDGPSFPETADGSKSTLGKLIAGPAALINQLALRSGLVRPLIPQAVRIANYLAALREVDDGKQLYSASFGIDAWSTASSALNDTNINQCAVFLAAPEDEMAISTCPGYILNELRLDFDNGSFQNHIAYNRRKRH